MKRPGAGRLLGRRLSFVLGIAGLAVGLAATGAYLAGRELDPGAAQTMAFATVALAELIFVFSVRTPTAPPGAAAGTTLCPRRGWLDDPRGGGDLPSSSGGS